MALLVGAVGRASVLFALLINGVGAAITATYCTHLRHGGVMTPTRRAPVAMASGDRYSRREVVQGDSFYKSFVKGGGGEALLGVIAAGLAFYGGTRRDSLFDDIAALDASAPSATTPHSPLVTLTAVQANGRVKLEVAAPAIAGPDRVDSMWVKDAVTGEIIAAQQFQAAGPPPVLSILVENGRRIVPVVHCTEGVTAGAELTAAL